MLIYFIFSTFSLMFQRYWNDQAPSQFNNYTEGCLNHPICTDMNLCGKHTFKNGRIISLQPEKLMQHKCFIRALIRIINIYKKHFSNEFHFHLSSGSDRRNTPHHIVMFPEVSCYKFHIYRKFAIRNDGFKCVHYILLRLIFFMLGQYVSGWHKDYIKNVAGRHLTPLQNWIY
jgi:hypothetical protein